jgi:hypothetical protein
MNGEEFLSNYVNFSNHNRKTVTYQLKDCVIVYVNLMLDELWPFKERDIIEYRVGGGLTAPVLSHHRTYGTVYGGSCLLRPSIYSYIAR